VISENFGEVEATRISKLFTIVMLAQFSFEDGLRRVESLYMSDLDTLIDLCFDKLAPRNFTIELQDIK